MSASPVYHICRRADWEAARTVGLYEGSARDRADGFIHFSTAEQVKESAIKHRSGESGLVLLTVDPRVLGDALKWAPARNGALFPHVYGALPMAARVRVEALPLGPDGRHVFPPLGRT